MSDNELTIVKNPIISGFNPDPSICRVDKDYYIVCSSFEMYPGLPIYHSTDLVNWNHISNAMSIENEFHVEHNSGMGGLMAPTIRYNNGIFYIINYNVSDKGNYLITAKNPRGPWSKPIWLTDVPNIDASLFFDDDNKAYILGTGEVWNDEINKKERGFWLSLFDINTYKLKGEKKPIFFSALRDAKSPEGPHLFRIGSYYYLLFAEGGTGFFHSVMVARAKNIFGPYENNPGNPVLTHRHLGRDTNIQNVGHADIIQAHDGNWYAVMLASRLIDGPYKNLGRETFICPVFWEENWPFFSPKTGKLELEYEIPRLNNKEIRPEKNFFMENFEDFLDKSWVYLGTPHDDKVIKMEKSHLMIKCIENDILPNIKQSNYSSGTKKNLKTIGFLGRRQQCSSLKVSSKLLFMPNNGESAGLALIQAMGHQIKVERVCIANQQILRVVQNLSSFDCPPHKENFKYEVQEKILVSIPYLKKDIILALVIQNQEFDVLYGENYEELKVLIKNCNLSIINPQKIGGMSGTIIGMFAKSDIKGSENRAKFDWFRME